MAFQALLSADALVPNHDRAVDRIATELGFQRLEERHVVRSKNERASWSFPRVHPDRGLAPTCLEFLQSFSEIPRDPDGDDYSFIPEIDASQGARPAKLHSTPIGVDDLDSLIGRLDDNGGRYRLHEPTALLPFRRLWIGFLPDGSGVYDPATDGGLRLELVPSKAHRLPADPSPVPSRKADGTIIRVVARTILVDDVPETVGALGVNLGLEPHQLYQGADRVERAVFGFQHPRSACLEALCPRTDAAGFETDLFRKWGAGACSIRFAVDGLAAFADRQRKLGIDLVPIDSLDDGPRLLRPLDPELGNAYEFVEWDGT